ncbi:MAG: hypothetical protein V2A34_04545 [Lentisphaerota bacterium]
MNRLWPCLVLWAGVGCLAGCVTASHPDDAWWGNDKAWHFTAGAALGAGTVAAGQGQGWSDAESAVAAAGVVAAAGSAKELYDARIRGTHWSWKDMAWNFFGCVVGGSLVLSME